MFQKISKFITVLATVALLATFSTAAIAAPAGQAQKDIVDIAVEDGRFTTLVTALQAADLVDTLKGDGPFTVFAPTDDAFAALPAGTLDSLLADIPALTNVLLYHVVPGRVMATDVVSLSSADTVLGKAVGISVEGNSVKVGDAQVIITDIEGSNGVIHVIDAVLLPPADDAMMAEKQDIVDIAVADGRFTTLVTALQAAGLVDTLKGDGPFTVFAPTDDAFAALPAGTLDSLLADIPALTDVLLYHVVAGNVKAADVVTLSSAATVQGQAVGISVEGNIVKVDNAQVIITDIEGSNGVIHVIDAVLIPAADDAMMAPKIESCSQDYVVQADDWLSKIADKFYGDVLAYNAIFDATNAAAAAGGAYDAIENPDVIQVGQVLCIPADGSGNAMAAKTIVDIAVADGRFTTLVTALQAADLVATLSGDGPFTVFAPTDEAFAALPAGTLDSLLADIPALTDVLLYHVVAGQVMAADVINLTSADTVLGQAATITVDGNTVKVDDAQVIITDIEGSNGVIHVIDAVLIPPK